MSMNGLGRSYLLAKILQRNYEVEIVGPELNGGIWEPVIADKTMTYKTFNAESWLRKRLRLKHVYDYISGDVIYVEGPLLTSYGAGLLGSALKRKPLVIDIDDWQRGFLRARIAGMSAAGKLNRYSRDAIRFYREYSYWNVCFMEKMVPLADEVTISNKFLKNKFGGTIIHHARDTDLFDPGLYDGSFYRDMLEIGPSCKLIMFFGSPRKHKGIEDLVKAVSLIEDENVRLVLVGLDDNPYSAGIKADAEALLGGRFMGFGIQPFEKIPEFISMADVVVVPQRYNPASVGQTPAKIFDAMSMGKPIIATNVGDLGDILEGCGRIVGPQDPRLLADAIVDVMSDPEQAESMGRRARDKCIEKYSYDAMEPLLRNIFDKYD